MPLPGQDMGPQLETSGRRSSRSIRWTTWQDLSLCLGWILRYLVNWIQLQYQGLKDNYRFQLIYSFDSFQIWESASIGRWGMNSNFRISWFAVKRMQVKMHIKNTLSNSSYSCFLNLIKLFVIDFLKTTKKLQDKCIIFRFIKSISSLHERK